MAEDGAEKLKKKIELGERETSRYESLAGATEYIACLLRKREDEISGLVNSNAATYEEILEYEKVRAARCAVTGEWSRIQIDAEAWKDEVGKLRGELAGEGKGDPRVMSGDGE